MCKSILGAIALALALAGSAQAALKAYDSFSYAAGSLSRKGLPTDPGFSTSWTQSGANGGNVVPAGLTYANLQTTGGALDLAGAGTTLNFRGLDNVYDAPADSSTGEIWWSYLMQPGEYTGVPFAGLSFYTDAIVGVAATDNDFATATRDAGGLKYGFSDFDIANAFASTVVPTNGVTTLIVGRVILGGGDSTSANNEDRIHLYINPAIGSAVPASSGNANVTVNFQTIRFATQNGAPFTVDEFRFGESFADVTPVIPPNADFNGSGVDLTDFHILRSNYLKTGALQSEGDANFDTVINHLDFFLWRSDFLSGGGSLADINWSPVPEPTSALLLIVGSAGLALVRRTRRQG